MNRLRVDRVKAWWQEAHVAFARGFRSHVMTAWQQQEACEAEARAQVADDLAADTLAKGQAETARIERARVDRLRELVALHGVETVEAILHAKLPAELRGEE